MNRSQSAVAASPDQLVLSTAEKDRLDALASTLEDVDPPEIDNINWLRAVRTASCELPRRLRITLRQFLRDSGGDGFLLLRDLPVHRQRLPATPTVAESVQRRASHPASMLALVALQLGEIVAYREEKHGALIQDVVPVPDMESLQSNAGSDELTLHVENAFHLNRPDFLCLLCLRTDHDKTGGLRVSACRKAIHLLSERTRRVLREPRFATSAPASFGGRAATVTPHAILTGCPEDPDIRVDFTSTSPSDEEAGRSLLDLRRALVRVARTVVLDPGDLAVVDNRVAVHGRTAFRPRYDGNDRWLQRVFIHLDFRRSRAVRPADGHVIHCE